MSRKQTSSFEQAKLLYGRTTLPGAPSRGGLSAWYGAIKRCKTEPIRVVLPDDSRANVDSTVIPGAQAMGIRVPFGEKWSDELRVLLQAQCGSHGTGLISLKPVWDKDFLNDNYFHGATGSWNTSSDYGPSQHGVGVVVHALTSLTIPFATNIPYDHLLSYCVQSSALNPWNITVDGKDVGQCGTGIPAGPVVAMSKPLALKEHAAVLTCRRAPCELYGVEGTAGKSGISVDNIAVGGCSAECYGTHPSNQLAFEDRTQGRTALVILDTISNEPGMGYSVTSFRNATINIIEYERLIRGSPSVIVYSPMQDSIRGLEPFYPALVNVAHDEGAVLVDMHSQFPTFQPQLFGPEGAHENAAGHLKAFQAISNAIK